MGNLELNVEHFQKRQFTYLLILGIITCITSSVAVYKFSLIVYWIQIDYPYINPVHPNITFWYLIVNLIQRVPILLTWGFLFGNIVRIYNLSGDKSTKIHVYFSGIITGILLISVIYFWLNLFSIIQVHYYSLLGSLESDFFLLTIANILELLLWVRLRSSIEISPFVKKEQKRKIIAGMKILILAISTSLLLRFIFIGEEAKIFGNPYNNFGMFYSIIFGACAVFEVFKAIFYVIGGILIGIPNKRRNKRKNFNVNIKK